MSFLVLETEINDLPVRGGKVRGFRDAERPAVCLEVAAEGPAQEPDARILASRRSPWAWGEVDCSRISQAFSACPVAS